jgi:hypothetical protein
LSLRVLHLVEGGTPGPALSGAPYAPRAADDDAAAGALEVCRAGVHGHTVCFVGPAWARRRAESAGLGVDAGFALPLGRPELGRPVLRRLWMKLGGGKGFDLVQAWSARTALLAAGALGPEVPLSWVSLNGAHRLVLGEFSRLRGAAAESPAHAIVACGEGALRPRVIAAPPPVRPGPPDPALRTRVREELGVEPGRAAVLLLSDPPGAGASRFAFALGLAAHAGDRVIGIVGAGVADLPRARRVQHEIGNEVLLVGTSRRRIELLAAADYAVWDEEPGPGGWMAGCPGAALPVAEALAAGVPVVAPRRAGLEPLLPASLRDDLLSPLVSGPELARRLIVLLEHPARAGAIAKACQEHLRAMGCMEGFLEAVRRGWDMATGPRVRVERREVRAVSA